LRWKPEGTEWVDYYDEEANYSDVAFEEKKGYVREFLDEVKPSQQQGGGRSIENGIQALNLERIRG